MSAESLLSLTNLRAWYVPGKDVLHNFSLDLEDHEIVGLIGLNGAGKTTFIKSLSGLHEGYQIDAARWQGTPFSFRDRTFKKNRYCVFAEDRSFQYFTFHEYLSYAASSYGIVCPDVRNLIHGFHFEEYTDVLLKDLSTGNRKKVYLISAFALKPELLLLDEPVNGLDFQSTEFLYQQINNYRKYGTILFSSHILESICLTSDRVLLLEQGRIRQSFSGKDIEADKIREVLRE